VILTSRIPRYQADFHTSHLLINSSILLLLSSFSSKVKRLFRYYSEELVQGRAVTSMVWNTLNSDLLAVGYGKIDTFVDTNKLGEILHHS
jgi:hypothetical protein